MSQRTVVVVLAVLVALFCTTAFAANIFISPTGNDTTGNGSIGSPYATLAKATSVASPGDTIQVRSGTYTNLEYLSNIHGTPGAYITINAYDGNLTAEFTAGVYFNYFTYFTVNGLSFTNSGNTSAHPIKICEGNDIVTQRSSYIQMLNCRFHDWTGGLQIKNQHSDYLLYQGCEAYNTVSTSTSDFCWDFFWITYSTVRCTYIHDFVALGLMNKAGSEYNLFEDNVIVNPRNSVGAAWGICGGSCAGSESNLNPTHNYQSYYLTVRNNIIKGTQRGGPGKL